MVILVKLIGVVIVILSVIYLLNPDTMKKYAAFWKKGKRLYTGAVISIIFGVIFLLAASQCKVAWIVAIFGILALIKGIALLMLGPKKAISTIDWWIERPYAALRLISLIPLIYGMLLIFSA